MNKTTEVLAVKPVVRHRCNSTHTIVKIARKMDVQVIIAGPLWRMSRDKAYRQAAASLNNPGQHQGSAGLSVADAERPAAAGADPASRHASTPVHALASPPAMRTHAERLQGMPR